MLPSASRRRARRPAQTASAVQTTWVVSSQVEHKPIALAGERGHEGATAGAVEVERRVGQRPHVDAARGGDHHRRQQVAERQFLLGLVTLGAPCREHRKATGGQALGIAKVRELVRRFAERHHPAGEQRRQRRSEEREPGSSSTASHGDLQVRCAPSATIVRVAYRSRCGDRLTPISFSRVDRSSLTRPTGDSVPWGRRCGGCPGSRWPGPSGRAQSMTSGSGVPVSSSDFKLLRVRPSRRSTPGRPGSPAETGRAGGGDGRPRRQGGSRGERARRPRPGTRRRAA